ncbi:MAG TPA: radical SAM protein [Sedimentibacter sp.]|jgi:histone acetyltransferase (RNA polymerase elongator complex component)|nr:radical SAM protein [Sedimentibacter sp.]NLA13304.1 radical SAM protein [Tissierellia bacterium]HAS90768.1 radical SAM protein [Clostridiales bacterium]HPB78878.1 radical SAM protein [Sedimentibacter sp.]HQO72359.1 radical SAM protein [Sedimentibacter sp.]
MNKKIKIIPIFVPHVGCPNNCVFCNQRRITGQKNFTVDGEYVHKIVKRYIETIDGNTNTEIAFFGGSFTAIDTKIQEELLKAAKHYKDLKIISSIRCSTRPDAINDEILMLQKKYGMDIIELGIQSLDDEVLKISNRGHNKKQSIDASRLIKEYGFILGHQIMPGLPGSSRIKDIKTCIESIEMKPDIVRIYPTLVIKDTELFDMYEKGLYKPLSLDEAVEISAYIYSLYSINDISVIRIGLQNTESINNDEDVMAGPFHPAFRQLVEERIYYYALGSKLCKVNTKELGESITIHAPDNLISSIAGQKRSNINKLKERFSIKQISFKKKKDDIIEIYNKNKRLFSFKKSEVFQNYLNMQQGDLCI